LLCIATIWEKKQENYVQHTELIYFLELNPPKTSLIISSNAEKYCSRFDYNSGKISKNKQSKNYLKLFWKDFQMKNIIFIIS